MIYASCLLTEYYEGLVEFATEPVQQLFEIGISPITWQRRWMELRVFSGTFTTENILFLRCDSRHSFLKFVIAKKIWEGIANEEEEKISNSLARQLT